MDDGKTQIMSSTGKKIAPYGSWPSPITADSIVAKSIRFGEVRRDGNAIYWLEYRPSEKGRGVIVRQGENDPDPVDITPQYEAGQAYFNVRTHVYEYGGGAWLVRDGKTYFTNFSDGRLYCQVGSGDPVPLTPQAPVKEKPVLDYADGQLDPQNNRWIGVIEDWSAVNGPSSGDGNDQPEHRIVAVDLQGGAAQTMIEGQDFYSSPRLSPNRERLAWLQWDHPNMPWQGNTLCIVRLNAAGAPVGKPVAIAGGDHESVFQPEWSPDARELWFISDSDGWWNPFRHDVETGRTTAVFDTPMEAEFGRPQWTLGQSMYAFVEDGKAVIAAYSQRGVDKLARIERDSGACTDLMLKNYTAINSVCASNGNRAALIAGGPQTPASVLTYELGSQTYSVLKKASPLADDPEIKLNLTEVQSLEFPTSAGAKAHALFYPPHNKDFTGPPDEKPPLVVMCHGGPTAQASSMLKFGIQFWTSRGIAVVDVNYRGSSGYGRSYRDLLKENWGVVDVEDCVNGAKWLAQEGWIDGQRSVITGGSAGGFTTLAALTFKMYFSAGASHYGIGDLEALAKLTHKFESRYLDWLVGPYPQQRERYKARSPINHVNRLSQPVIFFQGGKDNIVPKEQAESMVNALKTNGLPVGYFLFAEEGHGFRQDDNIRRAIEGEHYFFSFLVFRSDLDPKKILFNLDFRSDLNPHPTTETLADAMVDSRPVVFGPD